PPPVGRDDERRRTADAGGGTCPDVAPAPARPRRADDRAGSDRRPERLHRPRAPARPWPHDPRRRTAGAPRLGGQRPRLRAGERSHRPHRHFPRAGFRPASPVGLPGCDMTASILDGIVLGLQFGVLAAGLTLVYGLGGVLNLAYGQIAVVSGLVTLLTMEAGVPAVPAALIGLVAGGALAHIFYLPLLQHVYGRRGGSRGLLTLLLTLGAALVIDGYLTWRYPRRGLDQRITGDPLVVFGVRMRMGSVVASGITIVVIGVLYWLFRYTRLGRAIRSVIQDEEGSRLVGIDPQLMMRLILVLSGVLAAIVAITRSMVAPVNVRAGFSLTVLGLIVTVVGGLGSIPGAFLAGLVLGIINSVASSYIGTFLSLIILLVA